MSENDADNYYRLIELLVNGWKMERHRDHYRMTNGYFPIMEWRDSPHDAFEEAYAAREERLREVRSGKAQVKL